MNKCRCDECEWWLRNKNKPHQEPNDETYGECRVNPPVVLLVQAENERWYYMFPITPQDCWCGKFQAKKAK